MHFCKQQPDYMDVDTYQRYTYQYDHYALHHHQPMMT